MKHLERISSAYVAADRAPEALWRLGLLLLDPDGPERDPDQAVARLLALPELYPDSPRAPDALALVALLDAAAGRDGRALETAFRVLWRWPQATGVTGRAWLAAGRVAAHRGETQRALFCLGRAASSGEPTGSAERLVRLVDRLDLRAPAGEPAWALDLDHQLGLPERADDLAAAPDGRLFAAMGRENAIAEIDAAGRSATRRPQAGVIAVAVDAWSRLWMLVPGAVVGPPGAGRIALPEDLAPSALAISGARGIWVADRRGRRVVRLGAGGTIELTVGLADRGDPRALVPDGEGGVVVLDGRNRRLLLIDARGAPAGRIALGGSAGKPVDLDRDVRGDLYVLDAGAARVVVLDREGRLRASVSLPREGERGIARPERIAVDEAGRIAVYDARRRRVTWLR